MQRTRAQEIYFRVIQQVHSQDLASCEVSKKFGNVIREND